MKVQIYVTSYIGAKVCVEAGVDFIGVVADNHNKTPSSLSYSQVNDIFNSIPDSRMRVALTLERDFDSNKKLIESTNPDILHIGFEPDLIPIETIEDIRMEFPFLKILQAIPMNQENSLELAIEYQREFDYFIFDTNDPNRVDLGATGLTHDWNVSSDAVKKVNIPVIMAGGLSPDNVKDAIKIVKPWGVDSFSKTNLENSFEKDKTKVENFVKNAKSVF